MKKLVPIVLVLFTSSLSAALPPVWQDIAELKAIVNAPQLNTLLDSGDHIEGISRAESAWVLKTAHKTINITVVPLPQDHPGPLHFELEFKEAAE